MGRRNSSNSDSEQDEDFEKQNEWQSKLSVLDSLEENDEVFLMESSSVIDPHQLSGQNLLKLFESYKMDIEQSCTLKLTRTVPQKMQIVSSKFSQNISSVTVNGIINIERKLRMKKSNIPIEKNDRVPYPANLTQRHPLLGVDWENHKSDYKPSHTPLKKVKKSRKRKLEASPASGRETKIKKL